MKAIRLMILSTVVTGVFFFSQYPTHAYWIIKNNVPLWLSGYSSSFPEGEVLSVTSTSGWYYVAVPIPTETASIQSSSSFSVSSSSTSSADLTPTTESLAQIQSIDSFPTLTPTPTVASAPDSTTTASGDDDDDFTTLPPASSSSSSSRSSLVYSSPTPYPTRISGSTTIIINDGTQSLPSPAILPPVIPVDMPSSVTPTPFPQGWQGGIFIQARVRVDPQAPPNAVLPTASPLFIPGKDISSIEIKTPEGAANTSDGSTFKGIDLTVNKKLGEGVTSSQQEFIIQKAMQTITIAADEKETGTLSISKNDIAARISMAIQIDPLTNTLTVDTPQGRRRVSIMPDDAISIMRELRLLEQNATPSDILLESRGNQLAYRIQSTKIQKLLGFIPILIPKDVYIAADTGGVIDIKLSPFFNFITLFTF